MKAVAHGALFAYTWAPATKVFSSGWIGGIRISSLSMRELSAMPVISRSYGKGGIGHSDGDVAVMEPDQDGRPECSMSPRESKRACETWLSGSPLPSIVEHYCSGKN